MDALAILLAWDANFRSGDTEVFYDQSRVCHQQTVCNHKQFFAYGIQRVTGLDDICSCHRTGFEVIFAGDGQGYIFEGACEINIWIAALKGTE